MKGHVKNNSIDGRMNGSGWKGGRKTDKEGFDGMHLKSYRTRSLFYAKID